MPEAVIFQTQGKFCTVYFAQQNAVLPVRLRAGGIRLVPWGVRAGENTEMPAGGWARQTQIKNGSHSRWNLWLPVPVKIPVLKFMEKNFEGRSCWYEVTRGNVIQGLLARQENEYRVYIVTVDPEDLAVSHYRWPNIVVQPP